MHSTTQTIIGTQESVYRDSSIGNLDRNIWVRDRHPLQQGFDSNSQARFSIGIDYLSAFAFEQRIIGGIMSIPNSTAVGTPFARVPTTHDVQTNIIIKAPLLKNLFKLIERDSHNGLIESLAFGIESLEFFNTNVSIIFSCNLDYFSDDLAEIGLDKIPFSVPQSFQLFGGVEGLKQGSSVHNLFSLSPNALSEISLVQDFALWRNNADSEVFCVNINAENVLSLPDFFFFGQISNDLKVGSQAKGLAYPTILNQILKSLIVPVLLNWNCDSFSRIHSKVNKELGLCAECFAVSGNVKLDSQSFDFISFLFPSVTNKGTSDLNIKRGIGFAS
jgi:hypothetical protein